MEPKDLISKWANWNYNKYKYTIKKEKSFKKDIKELIKEHLTEAVEDRKITVYGEIIGRDGKVMFRSDTGDVITLNLENSENIVSTITTIIAKALLEENNGM